MRLRYLPRRYYTVTFTNGFVELLKVKNAKREMQILITLQIR